MKIMRDAICWACAGMATAGTPALSAFKITNPISFTIAGLGFLKAATDNIAYVIRPGFPSTSLTASQVSFFFFMIDNAGNLRVQQGPVFTHSTAASGYRPGAVEWPADDGTYCCIGAARVQTNASGAFVPGTTAFNAANQTTTYYNATVDYGVALTF